MIGALVLAGLRPIPDKVAMKIGIATQIECRASTLAIARGEYKSRADEPKYWFPSIAAAEDAVANGCIQVDGIVEYVDQYGQLIPKL